MSSGGTTAMTGTNPTDMESIELYIQAPDNSMMTFNLESEDKIVYLKSLILEQKKIPINKQILYLDDQKLDNARTISDCDIPNQSALTLKVLDSTQMYVFTEVISISLHTSMYNHIFT